jgi:hypothetical protein
VPSAHALYFGSSTDDTHPVWPDSILVDRLVGLAPSAQDETVIHVPVAQVRDRTLVCRYRILDRSLGDDDALFLIVKVALIDHANQWYAHQVDRIDLTNEETGETFHLPYPKKASSHAHPVPLW